MVKLPKKDEKIQPKEEAKEIPEKLQSEKVEEIPPEAKGIKDYLLQYQYGKEMKLGDPNSNPAPGSKSARMKEQLLLQPKVSIFIPRAEDEDSEIRLSVTLNGYRLDFPKQTYLELPQQIAEVIMESQKQQVRALQPYRIDRNKKTEEALS